MVALNSGLFLGGCCLSFAYAPAMGAGAVDLFFGAVDLVFSVAGLVVSTIRSVPLCYTWFDDWVVVASGYGLPSWCFGIWFSVALL